ncbi:MAG: S24 family peptidase, partial [Pseudoalteromonas sp.]
LYGPVQLTQEDEFQLEGVVTLSIRLHRANPELHQCMP